jgi:hypothetical protein
MAKKTKRNFFELSELKKENVINKLIREQKRTGKKTYVLFTSQWDVPCQVLLNSIKNKVVKSNSVKIPLFVINSFDTPHSFVIYDIKSAPVLVVLDGNDVYKEEYTPNIWHKLNV